MNFDDLLSRSGRCLIGYISVPCLDGGQSVRMIWTWEECDGDIKFLNIHGVLRRVRVTWPMDLYFRR
jgi:hypothetical protein